MDGIEGLVHGQEFVQSPIRVPVGCPTLGRILNAVEDPIDQRVPVETTTYLFIHADAHELLGLDVILIKYTPIWLLLLYQVYDKHRQINKY